MKSEIRHELRVTLTPKLLHFLTVLQMPILDLIQTLEHGIETNPALEEVEPESEKEEEREVVDLFDELDLYLPSRGKDYDEFNIMENIPALPENLFSYLEKEIKSNYDGEDLRIALSMLYDLDHEGFIHTPEEKFAEQLGVEKTKVHKIRISLQRLDPVGCFSYSSCEALKVQLQADGYELDSPECRLLEKASESDDFRLCDLDQHIIETLSKYQPKPGLKYSSDLPQYVVPDVIVSWREDQLIAFLNEDPVPKVRIRRELLDIVKAPKSFSSDEVKFAREKLQSAKGLLSSIMERNHTLRRLIKIIVETQHDFFQRGKDYIKPLTMKDVALRLNLSVSTISRAVSGKYLESPRGIMELKKFFVSGRLPDKKRRVVKRIQELITSENSAKPLSDSSIAQILKEEGVEISRRTIAKYRNELGYSDRGNRKRNDSKQ